jgi:cyclopropane fatty-acyl-phospholipid synthase-like methyltransferase
MTGERRPDWHYDDLRQVGLDFEDEAAVAAYDRNQGTGAAEDEALLDRLGVKAGVGPGLVMIDLGTGTGSFPRAAARRGARVWAVDVSAAMLAHAEARAQAEGLTGRITFRRAGFLTYDHDGPPADLVTSKFALHHLPDFWKAAALVRINRMLKPGGRLFLRDVVFSFEARDYAAGAEGWIARMAQADGNGFTRADFATHVRDEHSTFAWILEGLIERTGFRIVSAEKEDPAYADYLCVKEGQGMC